MKLCKVDQRGRIIENSLVDLMGEWGLTKEERTWAEYLTIDSDGAIYIWSGLPRLYEPSPNDFPLCQVAYVGRWVQGPANADYCDLLFDAHVQVADYRTQLFMLQYEENNNEVIDSENSRLVA